MLEYKNGEGRPEWVVDLNELGCQVMTLGIKRTGGTDQGISHDAFLRRFVAGLIRLDGVCTYAVGKLARGRQVQLAAVRLPFSRGFESDVNAPIAMMVILNPNEWWISIIIPSYLRHWPDDHRRRRYIEVGSFREWIYACTS